MKKEYYLIMIFSVLGVKLFENKLEFITKDINPIKVLSYISSNIYENDTLVSNIDIEVIDYFIDNNKLYIKPHNNEIILPVDGLMSNSKKNEIIISSVEATYIIKNIDNKYIFLYQYYNSYTVLGITNDYYIVEGNNLENIINKLTISYEKA